jgi:hypothetical protein
VLDLRKLNSITKYPSIKTYHEIGERGRLNPALTDGETFLDRGDVSVYEKVDGENSRIILTRNTGTRYSFDHFIGSREDLLFAKGDRIANPYGGISALLSPLADHLEEKVWDYLRDPDIALVVLYQESYGGSSTRAGKNYTNNKTQDYRVFDVFSLTYTELNRLMGLPLDKIASWRDNVGQPFFNEAQKRHFIANTGLKCAPLLTTIPSGEMPLTLEDTHAWLKNYEVTKVGINVEGKSEGVIVRSDDRSMIRKIRFEDYERTLRANKQ